jgi:hypothetical protein
MARFIRTDGTEQEVHPAGSEFTNEELHQFVPGTFTGISLTPISVGGLFVFVDDEGILKGLPINRKATEVLWQYRPDHKAAGTWLHGDVIIASAQETGDA